MSYPFKLKISIYTTGLLFPLFCFSIAYLLRLTGLDEWFDEHETTKALSFVFLGLFYSVITSVVNNKKTDTEIRQFALNFLLIPLIFVFTVINIKIAGAIFCGFVMAYLIHFCDDDTSRSGTIALAVICSLGYIPVYFGTDLFGLKYLFEFMIGLYIMFMMILQLQYNREYLKERTEEYHKSWSYYYTRYIGDFKNPINDGYKFAKYNFLLAFLYIGDILSEYESIDNE